jgi:hypothetical protein
MQAAALGGGRFGQPFETQSRVLDAAGRAAQAEIGHGVALFKKN